MIFASRASTACAVTAFQPKKLNGTVTVKLYQMAWLEHVVTDTILNWDKRKAHLSNSAGGNAQVVNGLHQVAEHAVAQAIQDFKPKYDVRRRGSGGAWADAVLVRAGALDPRPLCAEGARAGGRCIGFWW
ncbi:unnamed protein product [Closterium sp. Yama58-4]|nr:unnamed protein product [Closterium sp. Yama58-4]